MARIGGKKGELWANFGELCGLVLARDRGQRELDRNGNRENEVNLGQGEMPYRLIPPN